MRILIEGPDGAGKSTLAKSLAGALDMNILRMTANGGRSAREYEPKHGIAVYCFDNDIVIEVNDED